MRNNGFKEFVKKYILNNLAYKVLSLVIAVMIWLVIINVADPVTTRSFSGLEVEIRNQSAITSINQVYEVVEGRTVDFTVKGKASFIKNLKLADFSAYADLSKLSRVFAADITVKCDKAENESIEIDSGNQMLVVKLENVKSKNVQVNVETNGEVANGYYVGDFEIKPNIITVSGGESKIKKIDAVKVVVDVAGAKMDFTQKVQPIAYDKDGNVIDSSYFTYTNSGLPIADISVNVTVYKTKSIPVILDITGDPADNYVYEGEYEYSPETIVIGGVNRKLSKLDSLTIPVDITGVTGPKYETSIPLTDFLPDGVKAVNDEEKIAIRIMLEPLITKTMDISVADIAFKNVPEGLLAKYSNTDDVLTVEVKGTEKQLENYTAKNVGAYVDLGEAKKGNCYLQVQFDKLPDEYIISESRLVSVFIADASELRSPDVHTTVKPSENPETVTSDPPNVEGFISPSPGIVD